jgi:glycerol-3-phosphate acyltransferase PlsY
MYGREALVIAGSYAVGCFCTGYYLVRWHRRMDVREYASGSVGARNVGRLLGAPGFVLTLVCDVGKGAAVVGIARWMGLPTWAAMGALLSVVVGHVCPAQLRFRGGKGIATSLGALLAFDWQMLVSLLALFAVIYLVARHFTLSGIVAYAFLPLLAAGLGRPPAVMFGSAVLALLIALAHRVNLAAVLKAGRIEKVHEDAAPKGIPE